MLAEIGLAALIGFVAAFIYENTLWCKVSLSAFAAVVVASSITVNVAEQEVCVKVAFGKWSYANEIGSGLHAVWPVTTINCYPTAPRTIVRGKSDPNGFEALQCRAGAATVGSPVIIFPSAAIRYRMSNRTQSRALYSQHKQSADVEWTIKALADSAVHTMCVTKLETELLREDVTSTLRALLQQLATADLPGIEIVSFRWIGGIPRPASDESVQFYNTAEFKNTSLYAQTLSMESRNAGIAQAPRWAAPLRVSVE